MAVLNADGIADLVTATQEALGEMKMTNIATTLQDYCVMGTLWKQAETEENTYQIRRNILYRAGNTVKAVGLWETDDVSTRDGLTTITVPWRHMTGNYAYEIREKLMNTGKRRILDIVNTRRTMCMIDFAEQMEAQFWGAPSSSADSLNVFGVQYWLPNPTAADAGGFDGVDPSGFSGGAGGLDVATYPGWSHWTADYADISTDDLIPKMRKCWRQTGFKSPVPINDYSRGNGRQFKIFVNEDVKEGFHEIQKSQNDDLGTDLGVYRDGTQTFYGTEVKWIPYLDSESDISATDPVYMINFNDFYVYTLAGDRFRETTRPSPLKHNVIDYHFDLSWNVMCTNRRTNGVIAKV